MLQNKSDEKYRKIIERIIYFAEKKNDNENYDDFEEYGFEESIDKKQKEEKGSLFFINPLNQSPGALLKEIRSLEAIKSPKYIFKQIRNPVTEKSIFEAFDYAYEITKIELSQEIEVNLMLILLKHIDIKELKDSFGQEENNYVCQRFSSACEKIREKYQDLSIKLKNQSSNF